MAFPVTLNGRTYTLADFEGQNYVDGLPDAFEDFVTHAGDVYNTTSSSLNSVGTGSKTFTTADSGKPYVAGTPLRIAYTIDPENIWMSAIVTSYSGTTLVVDVQDTSGSGGYGSWNISVGGATGSTGATGADGLGFTGGNYNASTGAVTFTSNDGLGFSTGDLRGADGTGSGTVTSVAMSVPTGLTVSGSPITESGTLAVTFTSGYSIPTTASQTNWNTAYSWGDHSAAGYLTSYTETDTLSTVTGRGATTSSKVTVGGLVIDGEIEEQQYSLTGTDIDPANGTIQYKTLAANTTFTESLADGEYVILMIDDGAGYTITWPTITWVGGSAPTLETTGYNVINVWQVNGTVYGAFVGAA